jgi:replicative DNA helicase
MTTTTKPKVAPNSKESEMMVLGCMLTSINSLNVASDALDDSDFYYTEHKVIFQSLKAAYKQDKPADVHLICEELKRQDKLNDVGGAAYITTLAQYAGTSAYIEEYVEIVKNKSTSRELLYAAQEVEKATLEDPENSNHIIEELNNKIKSIESRHGKKIPIVSPEERLKNEEEFLKKYRGQKYLGLRVKTIQEFNEKFLGLRGLILLAAAPNVGKTALTIQIALEVLASEEDASLVYISLEMSEEQIFRRMLLNLSGLNFNSFVFGSQKHEIDIENRDAFFTKEELNQIKQAENTLKSFGDRLQIIDQSTCPYIDSRIIINHIESIKQRTNNSRIIVIIDYLQVWPTPTNPSIRFASENEVDKWRIAEMKKIRDAINDDPIIVISEARKPNPNEEEWGSNLSDVMGSARGTYTPDVVMLFSQITPKAIKKLWSAKKMPTIELSQEHEDLDDKEKNGIAITSFLAEHGISFCKLKAPKCRDGMQRFSCTLGFYFQKNIFLSLEKINWKIIEKLALEHNKNNKK